MVFCLLLRYFLVHEHSRTHLTEWMDLTQAEHEGPFSKRTLWNLIVDGRLPAYRPLRKKVLVKRSDLSKLIEASRVGADLDRIVDETVSEVLGR